MSRYGYSQSPHSPAPEIRITLSVGGIDASSVIVPAIADTGSEKSCVPSSVARDLIRLYGMEYRYKRARGALGATRHIPVCNLNVQVLKCHFEDLEVGVIERAYAILGRDILNRHVILLDGPRARWKVLK